MINYNSAVNVLAKAGFGMSNKCRFDGKTYHDFNSRKKDASVSLVVDELTGAVEYAEITTRKWDSGRGRYMPVKEKVNGLQRLMEKFAPRSVVSL